MATLVFDIETVAEPWNTIDSTTQASLTKLITKSAKSQTEHEKELAVVREQLVFSPLTASIVSLGMYDVERKLGAVYYVGDGLGDACSEGDFTFKERTEKELLEDFWEAARSYDIFVTFNGRAFDIPFLIHRSAILGVRPDTALLSQRYLNKQTLPYHVDLLDELTFYGAMKRQSLHMYCRAYGIESIKEGEGGESVAELTRLKKFRDIAHHNAKDVIATNALYEKWKQHLAPASFINAIEF